MWSTYTRSDAQTQSTAVTDTAGTSYAVPIGDCAVLSLAVSSAHALDSS